MCYSAAAVANFFIKKSIDSDVYLTHMHLQKMLFFAHAFFYKDNKKPLFSDPVVAWRHGPVIESLYHLLKKYGDGRITELIQVVKPIDSPDDETVFPFNVITPIVDKNDKDTVQYLNSVWDSLADIPTWKLRAWSHQEGGAWYKTVESQKIDPSNDNDVIEKLPRHLTILDGCIMECGR